MNYNSIYLGANNEASFEKAMSIFEKKWFFISTKNNRYPSNKRNQKCQ